jgi:hypothetical protein
MSVLSIPRHERRRIYYWSGIFCCVVGVLLLIFVLSRDIIKDQHDVPMFVGGYCAIFATVLSVFQILEHLSCFSDPECQTKIVRILLMVPVYAIISWVSILAPNAAEYFNLVRDAYESYAIYAFFSLMLALMGGVDTLYRTLMIEERPPLAHFFPLCWLDPIKISPRFIQSCRRCLFQFMVIKPLVTLVVIVLTAKGQMGEHLLDPTHGYFWTTLVYNISITIAFTALVYFYFGTQEFLVGKNAFPKFLCIKAVIFLSFWQGILIAILASMGFLPKFDYWSEAEAPTGLQDLLVCMEMLLVAFAHKFCFPSDEFAFGRGDDGEDSDGNLAASPERLLPPIRLSVSANLKYTLRHEDLWTDFKDIVRNR